MGKGQQSIFCGDPTIHLEAGQANQDVHVFKSTWKYSH